MTYYLYFFKLFIIRTYATAAFTWYFKKSLFLPKDSFPNLLKKDLWNGITRTSKNPQRKRILIGVIYQGWRKYTFMILGLFISLLLKITKISMIWKCKWSNLNIKQNKCYFGTCAALVMFGPLKQNGIQNILPCWGSILLSIGEGKTIGKVFQCHRILLAWSTKGEM